MVIDDGAKGACWTNLKEVREYAEEKLRTLGVKVSETNYMVPKPIFIGSLLMWTPSDYIKTKTAHVLAITQLV